MLRTKLLHLDKSTPIVCLGFGEICESTIINMSFEEMLELDIVCHDESIYDLTIFDVEHASLSSIVPTYLEIMQPSIKYEVEENENEVKLLSKNHNLNIRFTTSLDNINIEDESSDIILEDIYNKEEKSILKAEKLNYIYSIINKPGIYFKE